MKVKQQTYDKATSICARNHPGGTLAYSQIFKCVCMVTGTQWFPLNTRHCPAVNSITGYLLRPGEEVTLIQE